MPKITLQDNMGYKRIYHLTPEHFETIKHFAEAKALQSEDGALNYQDQIDDIREEIETLKSMFMVDDNA